MAGAGLASGVAASSGPSAAALAGLATAMRAAYACSNCASRSSSRARAAPAWAAARRASDGACGLACVWRDFQAKVAAGEAWSTGTFATRGRTPRGCRHGGVRAEGAASAADPVALLREGLARDTGKTLEEWAELARACPETKHRARLQWLKETYGLGVNRASTILDVAFPEGSSWNEPEALKAALRE